MLCCISHCQQRAFLRPHLMALTSHITYQHQPVAKLSSMVPCTDTLNVLYIHYTVQLIAHNSNLMTIPSQCLIAHLALCLLLQLCIKQRLCHVKKRFQ